MPIKILYSIFVLIVCIFIYSKIKDKKNSLALMIVVDLITTIIGNLIIPSDISLVDAIVQMAESSNETYNNNGEAPYASKSDEMPASSDSMSTPAATNAPKPTNTPAATNAPKPTNTPAVTNTPKPTNTPAATNAPKPTNTPAVTNTPEPASTPEPIAVELEIPPINDTYKSINDIADYLIEVSPIELTYCEGNITGERQIDTYQFVPALNGRYRFEATDMLSGMEINIKILNQAGKKVDGSSYGLANGGGVTINNIIAGETYTVQVEQYSGYGAYRILIGEQKSIINIDSGITQITDSIQYTDQKNIYEFIPPLNGRYRFEMDEMVSGSEVNMAVYNQGGRKVNSTSYGITNGGGLTIDNMVAGETYSIYITEYAGEVNYKLLIGYQKETVQINGETKISDSVQYTAQCNQYQFVPVVSGRYRFEISDIISGVSVNMNILNQAGKRVNNTVYGISNGGGLTINNLNADEVYTIQIIQYDLFSPYTLGIGYQKEPVELNVNCVSDTVQYKEQQNIYQFTPQSSGDYSFMIDNMISGMTVNLSAYNEGGGRIDGTVYGANNGYELTIKNMVKDETYSIYVTQYKGMGEYTLTVKSY